VVVEAVFLGILGLVITGRAASSLLWLQKMRRVSDVTGTVVGGDRLWTGRIYWTYPVVEFTARDGTQIHRTFRQLTRPGIGRTVRIVYDPATLSGGHTRWASSGLILLSKPPVIYSVWPLLWYWLETAAGLAFLAGCIAVSAGWVR
jgi:hypothetical protein